MSEASSAEKNVHGPGRAGAGGLAVPGLHGIPCPIVEAPAEIELAKRQTAVEASSERRDMLARKMTFFMVVLRTSLRAARFEAMHLVLFVCDRIRQHANSFYVDLADVAIFHPDRGLSCEPNA